MKNTIKNSTVYKSMTHNRSTKIWSVAGAVAVAVQGCLVVKMIKDAK